MKKRLWIGVATAALMLGGVSAGLVGASKNVAQVNATDANTYYILGSMTSWESQDAYAMTADGGNFSLTVNLAKDAQFKSRKGIAWGTGELGYDSTIFSSDYFTSDSGNVKVSVAGAYKITRSTSAWVSCVKQAVTEYTVSEYAVVDGVAEAEAYGTETAFDGTAFTPKNVVRMGYTHGGWFTDAACTTAYTATTLSAATNLYAKYTTTAGLSYVYFSAPSGWTSCYAYTFGGTTQFGSWPGAKVSDVTDGVNYKGKDLASGSGIYRIGYLASANDTTIIFNNNSGNQTANLTLAAGTFYKLTDASTGDAGSGAAAAVVYDLNVARRSVAASGGILAGSLCGISKAKATSLVAEYDNLDAAYKLYVDAATDYTYKYDDTSNKVDVSCYWMVQQLRVIAASGSGTASISNTIAENNGLIITLAILGAGAVAAGAMFVFRKKRHEAR
jgi:hypothetical protein